MSELGMGLTGYRLHKEENRMLQEQFMTGKEEDKEETGQHKGGTGEG